MELIANDSQEERIHALFERARASGAFDSHGQLTPDCAELVAELWDIAFNTLRAFLRDGRILTAGPIRQSMTLDEEDLDYLSKSFYDREDLAMEMIIPAIAPFMIAALDTSRWKKERSSLATFFVNRCLFNKGPVLNKWVKRRRGHQHIREQESSEIGVQLDQLLPFDQDEALDGFVFELIERAPMTVRPILYMVAKGFTVADAAQSLGISASAAHNRLSRYRTIDVVAPVVNELPETLWPSGYSLIDYLVDERDSQRRLEGPRRSNDDLKYLGPLRPTLALPASPF